MATKTKTRTVRNTRTQEVAEFKLENMTARPIELQYEGKTVTVKSSFRKGDVYVGAWTTHLPEQMAELKVGKAVHFSGQSARQINKMFRGLDYEVNYVDTNIWTITDRENKRQYILINWNALKAVRAERGTYERSIRRIKYVA